MVWGADFAMKVGTGFPFAALSLSRHLWKCSLSGIFSASPCRIGYGMLLMRFSRLGKYDSAPSSSVRRNVVWVVVPSVMV